MSQPTQNVIGHRSRGSSLLFLPLRALWHSFLLILIPATVALVIVVPLALMTKSARVEMRLATNNLAFTLLSGWQSGQVVKFLESVQVRAVTIWTDTLEVDAEELLDARQNDQVVLKESPLVFQAQGSDSWVRFQARAVDLTLSELRAGSGSKVTISKQAERMRIVVEPAQEVTGSLDLSASDVSVLAMNCKVLREDGEPVAGLLPRQQQRFSLQPRRPNVRLSSSRKVELELELADHAESDFPGTFSDFLRIRDFALLPGGGGNAVPIKSGAIRFRDIGKAEVPLQSDFVVVPASDTLDLVAIGAKSGGLDVTLSGVITSLSVGKAPQPDGEELPSLLEWIYYHQRMGIIIGSLVWISATALGAVRLIGELRKNGA